MTRHTDIQIVPESWPVAGTFRISRSALTEIEVVTVRFARDGVAGRGECRPYPRYGETAASVTAQIEAWRPALEAAGDGELLGLCAAHAPGAAANAVECAVVDWLCQRRGVRAWDLLGAPAPTPVRTAFTLSIDTPDAMAEAARAARHTLLKIKVSAEDAVAQMRAVAAARPDASLIVDANEALDAQGLVALAEAGSGLDIALYEQPLMAGSHTALPELPPGAAPVCADESLHGAADLRPLREAGYRAVNVKLDKTGGPVRALALMREAREMGFTVMAGCMVGTSLAMAPMLALAGLTDVHDLDGPLLLARDRDAPVRYEGERVFPPPPGLWG